MRVVKKLKFLLIVILLVAFASTIITYFSTSSFSAEKYKTLLEEELSGFLAYKVKIEGEVVLNYPNVLAYNVQIIDLVRDSAVVGVIETVKLNFGFFDWLYNKPKVSKIELKGGHIIISAFLAQAAPLRHLNHKVEVSNLILNDFILLDNVLIAEGKFYTTLSEVSFKGQLMGKQTKKKYTTNFTYNNIQDLMLYLKSDSAELKIDFSKNKEDFTVTGKGLPILLNDFTKISHDIVSESVAFQLNARANIDSQSFSLEDINFTSDIGSLKGKWIYEDKRLEVNLQSENLNIHTLNYKKKDLVFFSIINQFNNLISKLNQKDINTNISIRLSDISAVPEDLNNLTLHVSNSEQKSTNISLLGKFNNNLQFEVKGLAAVDKYKPYSIGSIKLNGLPSKAILDFFGLVEPLTPAILNLESQFYLAPQMFYLKDLKFRWGNIAILGNLNLQEYGTNKSIKINLNGYNVNLDASNISANIPQILANPKLETYLNLELYNLNYKNKSFDKVKFSLSAADGKVTLKNIDIEDASINLKAHLEYQPLNINANLTGKVYGKYLDLGIINIEKLAVIKRNNNISNIFWSNRPLNFTFFENYNGGLNVKFEKIKWETQLFTKAELITTFASGIVNFQKIHCEGDKKEFNASGSLSAAEDNLIKMSFSYTNFDMLPLFKESLKINAIKGRYSCVGSFNTHGKNIKEFVNNSNGKLELAARQVEIEGVNFNSLVEKLPSVTNKRALEDLTKVDFFEGNTSFKALDGKVNIANGIGASVLHFATSTTNGVVATNFLLDSLKINSIAQIFFIVPKWNNTPISIDMHIENNIWEPKIFFDNDKVFSLIQAVSTPTKSAVNK